MFSTKSTINNETIGERLKREAKERGLTVEALADIVEYKNPKNLYDIFSGKRQLKDEKIKKLVDAWNVREDYLRCKDNYPTEDDKLEAIRQGDMSEFNSLLPFLKSLGLEVTISPFWHARMSETLSDDYNDIMPYLVDSERVLIEENREWAQKSKLDHDDSGRYYEMNALPPGSKLKKNKDTTYAAYKDYMMFQLKKGGVYYLVENRYIAKYNGIVIGSSPLDRMNGFFHGIQSAVKGMIDSMINSSCLLEDINKLPYEWE